MPSSLERGQQVAALLEGSWRRSPPALALSRGQVEAATALVLATGAGALAFWRLRDADRMSAPEAAPFKQAYRLHAIESAFHEERLPRAFLQLRAAGLEPVLGKGWAAARLYPETGLRPYGDIDLYVPAGHHPAAAMALRGVGKPPLPVDLHRGFADLEDRDPSALLARSRLVDLAGFPVRIFSPEDHLRLLALHGLRHGLARPVWLCDVAAVLEGGENDLDWDYLLLGSRRRMEAVLCTLGLARRLLGARLPGAPAGVSAHELPRWLLPAVLRQWGAGSAWRGPIEACLPRPAGARWPLRRHWPNPLAGTMGVGAPFNELPRLPFQLAYAGIRLAGAVRRWIGR